MTPVFGILAANRITTRFGYFRASPKAPMPNAFMGHHDATFRQDQLDITQAEAEDVIQPDRVADDLGRKPVSWI